MNRATFLSTAAAALALALAAAGVMGGIALADGDGAVISHDAFLASARAPFRHKQLFTSPRANNGAIFAYMRNSLNGYQFGWNEGPGTLHVVAVLNGLGVAQGVDDEMWSRYGLAGLLTRNGDAVKSPAAERLNPWLHPAAQYARDDADPNGAFNQDASIGTLLRRSATFYVCNNALRSLAAKIVEGGAGKDVESVHADLRRHLIPGALLVPAGVTTVDALQQEHFTLYDAGV